MYKKTELSPHSPQNIEQQALDTISIKFHTVNDKKNCQCVTIFLIKDSMVWFMVFSASFNNISVISWRSVFLIEETGVSGENHQPVAIY